MSAITKTISEIFPAKTVVIVGDLVADQFLNGTISRVSREAPVFILKHEETTTRAGAAANAAVNVASLGGNAILIGFVGDDSNGQKLLKKLVEQRVDTNGVTMVSNLSTTTKIRVLAGQHYAARQQVIRIDYENSVAVPSEAKQIIRQKFAASAAKADAIIMSDYNYGAVFPEIVEDAKQISRERSIPLVVDSRYALESLANATTATPNREEVEAILGKDFSTDDCSAFREKLGLKALLITNGNEGMLLFEAGRPPLRLDVVGSDEPVDVTGAGDTVIAAYALGLASGASFADAANIANHAGGLVVMKKGTASVTGSELIESLATQGEQSLATKAE